MADEYEQESQSDTSTRLPTTYSVKEHDMVNIPLSDLMTDESLDFYPEVVGRGLFQVHLRQENLIFQAGGYIGLIPINAHVTLDVRPKVPIANLERILSVVDHKPLSLLPHLRDYDISDEGIPSLVDIITESFIESFKEIKAYGMYSDYQKQSRSTSFPHGRIVIGKTIQEHKSRGVDHRASVSWFERGINNAVNRCLKYTIWFLAQRYSLQKPQKGIRKKIATLNELYALFQGVPLDESREFLTDKVVKDPTLLPVLRQYCAQPLYLATTILQDRGVQINSYDNRIRMASFVINFDEVFEDYVRNILTSKLVMQDVSVLDGNTKSPMGAEKSLFDDGYPDDIASRNKANPDIVVQFTHAGNDTFNPIILDTKYKITHSVPDRDDLNQIITYAASYRSPYAIIIYPSNMQESGLKSLGHIGELQVFSYTIDLNATDLVTEEQLLIDSLSSLLSRVI